MQDHNQKDSGQGASEKAAESCTPQHTPPGPQPAEQKTIGIGMPTSEVEMERLKEAAKKPDK